LINSRTSQPEDWMGVLKSVLSEFGNTPKQWDLYRGDSFQLEISPEKALFATLIIKARLKHHCDLKARIAIGIGDKSYDAENVTESNGSAFLNSGECFEKLKKNTLAISTGSEDLNQTLNLMFQLASVTIDNWTPAAAELVEIALKHPNYNQKQIAETLQTTQSNVSQGLNRGGYDELSKLISYFESKITKL
ncbi:MAG: SatD family protein, partial [Bacteroidota bacterium]